MLDKKVKKEWIEALRSGYYRQTDGILHDKNGFCCLGVLADIAHDDDWEKAPHGWGFQGQNKRIRTDYLPVQFRKKIGLSIDAQRKLSLMNDSQEMSFNEIANYIEKSL